VNESNSCWNEMREELDTTMVTSVIDCCDRGSMNRTRPPRVRGRQSRAQGAQGTTETRDRSLNWNGSERARNRKQELGGWSSGSGPWGVGEASGREAREAANLKQGLCLKWWHQVPLGAN
jgi:hypothetical protein